jgi:large subunit ribosomal protein L25
MVQQISEIKATRRRRAGKGGARSVRRDGAVPGILYGGGKDPEAIALDQRELALLVARGKFLSTVFELNLDGSKLQVIPREVQADPVKDTPLHIDLQRVTPTARIRVNVPVRFINESLSPGLKRGGVLNVVRHEIEVTCPANAIPDYFEFNLEGLDIGRSVHISAITLPEGVRTTIINRDFTVATIAGHKIEEEPTPGAEAAAVEGAPAAEGAEAGAVAVETAEGKAPAGKEAAGKAPVGKEAAGKPAAVARPAAATKPAEKGKK